MKEQESSKLYDLSEPIEFVDPFSREYPVLQCSQTVN